MKRHAHHTRTREQATQPTDRTVTTNQMTRTDAHHRLHRLLAEAGLRACRIEYDPSSDVWTVFAIQSTREGTWQNFVLQVGSSELDNARDHSDMRDRLVARLATSLSPREAPH
jgi:hypothetical protein